MNKMTREMALEMVRKDKYRLGELSLEFRKDKEIVLAATTKYCDAILWSCIDESLKHDREFLELFTDVNFHNLQHVDLLFRNDAQFMLSMIKNHGSSCFSYVGRELLQNRDFIKGFVVLGNNNDNFRLISHGFKKDKEIALIALKKSNISFYSIDDSLKTDKDIMYACIHDGHLVPIGMPMCFKRDKEVVLHAVKCEPWNFLEMGTDFFKEDIELALICVRNNKRLIDYFHPFVRTDKNVHLVVMGMFDVTKQRICQTTNIHFSFK